MTPRNQNPTLRFKDKNGKPFPDWEEKQLGEVCDILDNQRKPITESDRKTGQYPYYGATGIVDYIDDYIFSEKLVLIGEDGANWNAGANTAFIAEGKYWVNNHAHVIRPHRQIALDEMITNFLNWKNLNAHITGITVRKLNQDSLKNILLSLPHLAEQKKIADFLSAIDEKIDALRHKTEKMENYKRGAMQQIFSQKIRFKDKNGKPFPAWEEKRFGDIAKVDWGNTDLTKESYIGDGTYLAVSATGIDGRINCFEHEPNVVVLSAIGAQCGKVFFPKGKFTAIKNTITFTPKNNLSSGKYIYYLSDIINFPKRGAAQPFISKGDIENCRIQKFPTLAEQKKIADFLTAIDEKIDALRRKAEQMEAFKQGLMQKMFV